MSSTISVILVIAFIAFYWYTDNQVEEARSQVEETMYELFEITKQRTEQLNKAYADIATLQAQLEQVTFTFYYVPTAERYGVDNLQEYLQRWRWKEGIYAEGEFDCSQMSAYLERKLENDGFHTIIVAGDSPSDSVNRHAWLLVETSEGKYTPVEATAYDIVSMKSPNFYNYFKYEYQFETIQEAVAYSPTDFEWWD